MIHNNNNVNEKGRRKDKRNRRQIKRKKENKKEEGGTLDTTYKETKLGWEKRDRERQNKTNKKDK